MFWILTLFTGVWIAFFIVVHATTVRKLRQENENLNTEVKNLREENEELDRAGWALRGKFDELALEHYLLQGKFKRALEKGATYRQVSEASNLALRSAYEAERAARASEQKSFASFRKLVNTWHGRKPVPQPQEQKSDHAARVQTLVACASLSPQLRRMLGM